MRPAIDIWVTMGILAAMVAASTGVVYLPQNSKREAIRSQIATVKLGSREGGLMLHAECEPDVPLENIEAICQSLEKYRLYYS